MSSDKILSGQEQDSRQSHETSPTPETTPESAARSSAQAQDGSPTGAPEAVAPETTPAASPSDSTGFDSTAGGETVTEQSASDTSSTSDTSADAGAAASDDSSSPAEPDSSTPAAGEETAAAPRRPRLQPTVAADQARAIPTYGSETASAAAVPAPASSPGPATGTSEQTASAETSSEATAGSTDESASPEAPGAIADAGSAENAPQEPAGSTAVEIPSSDSLDAQMEAEIEAAMSSGDLSGGPAPAPAAPTEQAAGEAATSASQPAEEELEPGVKLTGKIQEVGRENVFLDLGYRSPGVVAVRQFEAAHKPQAGQLIEVVVDRVAAEEGLIYLNLPRGVRKLSGNWDSITVGQVVDCMVMKTNKGGLEVNVGSIRGFLPASQVELGYVSDLEPYVNQKLRVEITEANPKKRNLIVSRRAFLQKERAEVEKELWQTLATGQKFSGTVKTIKNYGAFIDIGGTDGFLHIGEMSWQRIKHPGDVLSEGQQVEVVVISLDEEKKRIGLGMRQLTQNPWSNADQKFAPGSTVSGTVTRIAEFGAFVELEAGVEGLIHISELDYQRVRRVGDVLRVGQTVEAQVLEVDTGRNRISLSLKALKEKPDSMKDDEDLAPGGSEPFKRKRKGPLKGGTGSTGGGGLFGNPDDFS